MKANCRNGGSAKQVLQDGMDELRRPGCSYFGSQIVTNEQV